VAGAATAAMATRQPASRVLLLLLGSTMAPVAVSEGAHGNRDRQLAPARWWCAQSSNAGSIFCKTAVLKDAIAMAEPHEKQAKVDALRAAILAGTAEAEGLDATNPERQRMMEAWCASDDPARTGDKKSSFMCAKAKAKSDFYKRREELLAFWCGEQGHAGSPKCKQMEFGKRMQSTDSGEERKRMAMEFRGASNAEERAALETETREMMQAVCTSPRGETPFFVTTCAKLQPGSVEARA